MPSSTLTSRVVDGFEKIIDDKIKNNSSTSTNQSATVTRIDDSGMVWVHISNGASETPVNGSILSNASKNDTVLVNIEDGKCSIVGNISSPATDDTKAKEAIKIARDTSSSVKDLSTSVSNLGTALGGEIRERNVLKNEVREYETKIEQTSRRIGFMASSISSLNGRLGKAETSIELNSEQIELKANKQIVNTITGDTVDLETLVIQNAGDIQTTVTKVETVNDSLSEFKRLQEKENENLQNQIDGSITTWFYEGIPQPNDDITPGTSNADEPNAPAVEWDTDDLRNVHLGDLYYDTTTGYCYRWLVNQNGVYYWTRITDVDLQVALDTANRKKSIFIIEPTPPYQEGDLWFKKNEDGTSEMYLCNTPRTSTDIFNSSDWDKVDDADLESFKKETATKFEQTDTAIEATVIQIENDKKTWSKAVQTVDGWVYEVLDEDGNVTQTLISGDKIKTGSITADQIAAGTITGGKIASNTIEGTNIKADSIEGDKIKANTIDGDRIKASSIDGDRIKAGTLTGDLISANTIKTENLDADSIDAVYLKADFGNFKNIEATVANVWKLYAYSGMVNELSVAEGNFTHELNAVLINGDLIRANSITAKKINIIGEDGIIRQINLEGMKTLEEGSEEERDITNSLNGQILLAKSVTADRISVTDLSAFEATIAGIMMESPEIISDEDGNIVKIPGKLHTNVKDSVTNSLSGYFLDSNGNFALGNSEKYIRFYNPDDPNGEPTDLEMKVTRLSLETGDLVTSEELQTYLTHDADGLKLSFNKLIDTGNSTDEGAPIYISVTPGIYLTHENDQASIQLWSNINSIGSDSPILSIVGNTLRLGNRVSSPEFDVGSWRWTEQPAKDIEHGPTLSLISTLYS